MSHHPLRRMRIEELRLRLQVVRIEIDRLRDEEQKSFDAANQPYNSALYLDDASRSCDEVLENLERALK